MIRRSLLAGACLAAALWAATAEAETVVTQTKMTGATARSANYADYAAGVGVSVMQTQLLDGNPAVIVQWGSQYGGAAGAVPSSAVRLRGDRIEISLDVTMLPPGAMVWGSPGSCVGTFIPTPNDGQTALQWSESNGNQTTRSFQPFWWFPGGGGMQYETRTTGRTLTGTARFEGTCAGVTMSGPAPMQMWQMGQMQTHAGSITQVITMFP